MKEKNVFDRLLLLPLFQGMTKKEFMEIAECVPLGFSNKEKGVMLVKQDELCTGLTFVMEGEVCAELLSDSKDYVLKEWLNIPLVLQPECLFGISTCYSRSFRTMSSVQLLRIEKDAVRDVLFRYPTFRINYLNLLSARAQRAYRACWRKESNELPTRFIQFLSERCLRPAGYKELHIKMENLADELLSTRLRVSKMLNDLADLGKIELRRGSILVQNMELLLMTNTVVSKL